MAASGTNYWHQREHEYQVRGSIVVSISACHAEDPGSIPGRGAFSCRSDRAMFVSMFLPAGPWRSGLHRRQTYEHLPLRFVLGRPDWGFTKELFTLLGLCVSSLRRGHANLFCTVPILTGDPPRKSERRASRFRHTLPEASPLPAFPVGRGGAQRSCGTSSCSKAPKGIYEGFLALSHEHVQ